MIDKNNLKCDQLKSLCEFKVDPTEYLLSSMQCPEKVIKISKNEKDKRDNMNIHFHE